MSGITDGNTFTPIVSIFSESEAFSYMPKMSKQTYGSVSFYLIFSNCLNTVF